MGKPLVSIVCTAYNHERFIKQCIEGFIMQRTDFQFEVLINDDASTDKTADIIRSYVEQYPSIIKPIYQKRNQYSKNVGLWRTILFPRSQGKYIAICEGDDYWTDPFKLQKQVDFLEENSDFSFICGGYREVNVLSGEEKLMNLNPRKRSQYLTPLTWEITYEDMKRSWVTKTLTAMFRKECLKQEETIKYRLFRDVVLFYLLRKAGRGLYMKEVLGIYRVHPGGVHSGASVFEQIRINYRIYHEIYVLDPKDNFVRFRFLNANLLMLHFKDKIGYKRWVSYLNISIKLARKGGEYWLLLKELIKVLLNYPIKT